MEGNSQLNNLRVTLLQVADRLSSLQNEGAATATSAATANPPTTSIPVVRAAGPSGIGNIPGPSVFIRDVPATRTSHPETLRNPAVVASAAAREHRRLFNYRSSGANTNKKCKRPPTCTLKFVCMAKHDSVGPPIGAKNRAQLANAGLGDSSIQFELHEGTLKCHERIIGTFPKLGEVGYELLIYQRGGEGGGFYNLAPPYTPRRLKEASGNAKIYIRPLQKDLDVEEMSAEQRLEVGVEARDGHMITCLKCGISIEMSQIRNHQDTVHGSPHAKRQRTNPIEAWIDAALPEESDTDNRSEVTVTGHNTTCILQELCPSASGEEIVVALQASGGDPNIAAQNLLGGLEGDADHDESLDHLNVQPMLCSHEMESVTSPLQALDKFRTEVVAGDLPRQLFSVSRMEGNEELKLDIFSHYKDQRKKFNAQPRVRFENEEGVGSGPVREFLLSAMTIVDEGLVSSGASTKPVLFFEGERNHRIPIHDQSLRLMGAFKSIGRIIGHCALHGGPVFYGLSPAIKYCWINSEQDVDESPPPIVIEDVADIELRELICQLDALKKDERPSHELCTRIEPYCYEAGLDIDQLHNNSRVIAQGLMLYQVIHKRKLELDDICKGMNAVSLQHYLAAVVFPTEEERRVTAAEMKQSIDFDDKDVCSENVAAAGLFMQYIDEIDSRKEEGAQVADLCCFWTGSNTLPPRRESEKPLLVKFDGGASDLPLSETCFLSIVIPSKHKTYDEFKRHLDVALKYGSCGFSFS